MKLCHPFHGLSRAEWAIWLFSLSAVLVSFFMFPGGDVLTLCASLIGVTALIFVAKGYVAGQVLTVVFAVVYGIISYRFAYYGEMITYLGMTSPIALLAVFSWLRNPYGKRAEVKVRRLRGATYLWLFAAAAVVTLVFYFVLGALGTANLWVSTLSVTTSFLACMLTFLRNPYYALAYAANDIVLVALWVYATLSDFSFFPMAVCFSVFFINDMYGLFNWRRMEKRQKAGQ